MASADRRQQIALVALQLIAHEGPQALSLAAVARRLGLVPSAIYRHFKGKEEIIDAALDLIEGRLHDNVERARRESGEPPDALRAIGRLLELHVELIRENQAVPRILFAEQIHGGLARRKRRIAGLVTGYLREIAALVEAGQAAGRIRADLEPETVAFLVFGVVPPAGMLWILTEGRFDVTRQVARAWQVLAATLAIDPASTRSDGKGCDKEEA